MERRNRRHAISFLKASRKAFVFLLLWLAGGTVGLSAQTAGREMLSAGGSAVRQPLGQGGTPCLMTWTIGEPLNETYAGSKKILSQGFLQGEGYIRDTVGMDTVWNLLGRETERLVEILCYPNPTRGPFQFVLNPLGRCAMTVEAVLTDVNGRCLWRRAAGGLPWRETVDLSAYPAGTYLLGVRLSPVTETGVLAEKVRHKTYRIIKN